MMFSTLFQVGPNPEAPLMQVRRCREKSDRAAPTNRTGGRPWPLVMPGLHRGPVTFEFGARLKRDGPTSIDRRSFTPLHGEGARPQARRRLPGRAPGDGRRDHGRDCAAHAGGALGVAPTLGDRPGGERVVSAADGCAAGVGEVARDIRGNRLEANPDQSGDPQARVAGPRPHHASSEAFVLAAMLDRPLESRVDREDPHHARAEAAGPDVGRQGGPPRRDDANPDAATRKTAGDPETLSHGPWIHPWVEPSNGLSHGPATSFGA